MKQKWGLKWLMKSMRKSHAQKQVINNNQILVKPKEEAANAIRTEFIQWDSKVKKLIKESIWLMFILQRCKVKENKWLNITTMKMMISKYLKELKIITKFVVSVLKTTITTRIALKFKMTKTNCTRILRQNWLYKIKLLTMSWVQLLFIIRKGINSNKISDGLHNLIKEENIRLLIKLMMKLLRKI